MTNLPPGPIPDADPSERECELCGEPEDDEMGEFWDEKKNTSVIAHAQCGLDAHLHLA